MLNLMPCLFRIHLKNFLKKNDIQFEEVDISKDEKMKQEMIKKSEQMSVPVTEIGGKIFVGYKISEIKEALGLK